MEKLKEIMEEPNLVLQESLEIYRERIRNAMAREVLPHFKKDFVSVAQDGFSHGELSFRRAGRNQKDSIGLGPLDRKSSK